MVSADVGKGPAPFDKGSDKSRRSPDRRTLHSRVTEAGTPCLGQSLSVAGIQLVSPDVMPCPLRLRSRRQLRTAPINPRNMQGEVYIGAGLVDETVGRGAGDIVVKARSRDQAGTGVWSLGAKPKGYGATTSETFPS